MSDWTPSELVKVGDKVRSFGPPPLAWWDRFLWKLFRIERKRPNVWRDYVVTATSDDE